MLGGFDSWQQAARRPATTRTLRRYQLGRFARDHPDPGRTDTSELAGWLGRQAWSAETMRSYRATLRVFYRWALLTGQVAADPAALLPPIRPPQHLARPCPDDVWRRAAMTAPARVRLAILLAARQGLRCGEVARARREDLRADLGGVSLVVLGKGDRLRVVPLDDDMARMVRQAEAGWLFPGPSGHLSPNHLGRLVSAQLGPRWTMHTLRHRFATVSYRGTDDLCTVQQLLGHSKVETTRGYVQVAADALRAGVVAAR
ncbi:MAG: tyrosine-type recombinase/integrase [Nocardioidaceae bacterium]